MEKPLEGENTGREVSLGAGEDGLLAKAHTRGTNGRYRAAIHLSAETDARATASALSLQLLVWQDGKLLLLFNQAAPPRDRRRTLRKQPAMSRL